MTRRAAVIGLGRIGFQYGLDKKRIQPASHFHCYNSLDSIEGIGICDTDDARTQNVVNHYSKVMSRDADVKHLLDKVNPEIVSICTPTNTHAKVACEVADHPSVQAIFLEKPMAESLEDADKIIKACIENNVRLTVNYGRRWHSLYVKAAEGAFDSAIGIHPGPLLRTGTHMIDLFNWIFGKPMLVQAFGEAQDNYLTYKTPSNDYNINGVITYKGGAQAILYSGFDRPKLILFELDLFSEDTRVRIIDNGLYALLYEVKPSRRYQGLKELVHWDSARQRKEDECLLLSAIKEMIEAVKMPDCEGRNSCRGIHAREALRVALGLHYSTYHNRRLVLKDLPKDYKVESY